ncbi:MAG: hypothetical protein KC561_13755, partial [Myxococcales bacterium]|nr:hypothetical protein [Myxococcales bacterium]
MTLTDASLLLAMALSVLVVWTLAVPATRCFGLLLFLGVNAADYQQFSFKLGLPGLTDRVYISDVLLALSVFGWFAIRAARPRRYPLPPLTWPVVTFVVIGVLNIFRGIYIDAPSAFGEGRFVLYALTYFVAFDVSLSRQRTDLVLKWLVAVVVAVSAVGCVAFVVSGTTSLKALGFPGKTAIYAVYILVAINILKSNRPAVRATLSVVLVAAVVFSGVRTAIALIPVVLLTYRRKERSTQMTASLVALTLVGLAVGWGWEQIRPERALDMYGGLLAPGEDSSMQWRLTYWVSLLRETDINVFLVGTGIHDYFGTLHLQGFQGDTAD